MRPARNGGARSRQRIPQASPQNKKLAGAAHHHRSGLTTKLSSWQNHGAVLSLSVGMSPI
jgi:hypothetical protein